MHEQDSGSPSELRARRVVDWSAALWAGLVAGIVFLVLVLFWVPRLSGGNAWAMVRLLASIAMGKDILAPPATFDGTAFAAGCLVHFVLSIGFALVLALILHRRGLVVGILGGALFGLGLYAINAYILTLVYPWFSTVRGSELLIAHAVFGAVAGGVYARLEVEELEPVEEDEAAR